ncbi:MAG: mechanosensitive ion channel [Bacteroides sp.]|nr:mechanosensitive ion channel [Bacteroides sp.]MCM1447143.1 mechanosensitive ion channel [Bacteroides sp.]
MKELQNGGYVQELIDKGIDLGIEAGKSIIVAVIIYFVGKAVISLINRMLGSMMERRKVDPTIRTFMMSLVNILLLTLLVISVVSALGVNTTSFAALLASAGVAVGMALSGNLQNLAGGIVILLFRPFKVGDYIEAQGSGGTVSEIQIFHTILTTPDNKKLFLPNGALSSGNITNFSREALRRVELTVSIEYGEDVDKVRGVLLELLAADDRIQKEPAPLVALGALADSSVNLTVRVWVNSSDYWNVFFQTNEAIYKEFNRRGINFPFPQLTVHQA